MKPLLNNVVIKPDPVPQETEGGVQLPDTVMQVSDRGTVVEVGPGQRAADGSHIPMPLEKGDRVFFRASKAPGISIGGEQHIILREHDILSILEAEDEHKDSKSMTLITQ